MYWKFELLTSNIKLVREIKLNQFIAHQSRFRNVICTVRYLGNDRMKVFFSPWRELSRLIRKQDLNKTNYSFVSSDANTNHSTSNTQGQFESIIAWIHELIIPHLVHMLLTLCGHPGNFPFSRLWREKKERKPCMHATWNVRMKEKKGRCLSLGIWVEVTCHSKTRLHEYQDGGCFGVESRWHLRPDLGAVNEAH